MSFILNALRKSEQERQVRKTETLENRILDHSTAIEKKTSIWLIILVFANAFFISYFIWFFITSDKTEMSYEKKTEKAMVVEKKEIDKLQLPQAIMPQPTTSPKQLSIADQLTKLRANKVKAVIKPTIPKQDIKQVSVVENMIKEPAISARPLPQKKPTLDKVSISDNVIKQKPVSKELPFLSELSYEFRRTVPLVEINVFVYSETENNRFIMIAMKKYITGQYITSDMLLKEIRINSIVVHFNNKTFQLKRK